MPRSFPGVSEHSTFTLCLIASFALSTSSSPPDYTRNKRQRHNRPHNIIWLPKVHLHLKLLHLVASTSRKPLSSNCSRKPSTDDHLSGISGSATSGFATSSSSAAASQSLRFQLVSAIIPPPWCGVNIRRASSNLLRGSLRMNMEYPAFTWVKLLSAVSTWSSRTRLRLFSLLILHVGEVFQ